MFSIFMQVGGLELARPIQFSPKRALSVRSDDGTRSPKQAQLQHILSRGWEISCIRHPHLATTVEEFGTHKINVPQIPNIQYRFFVLRRVLNTLPLLCVRQNRFCQPGHRVNILIIMAYFCCIWQHVSHPIYIIQESFCQNEFTNIVRVISTLNTKLSYIKMVLYIVFGAIHFFTTTNSI